TVDNLKYPSVSIFITTMLITQTGVTKDIRDTKIFKRGTPVSEARKLLLIDDNTFVDSDQANEIYFRRNVESHTELIQTYARIAMRKKFEDIGLGQLLLLTSNAYLVWNDPDDVILGTGTNENKGQNIGGTILMELRQEIKENSSR